MNQAGTQSGRTQLYLWGLGPKLKFVFVFFTSTLSSSFYRLDNSVQIPVLFFLKTYKLSKVNIQICISTSMECPVYTSQQEVIFCFLFEQVTLWVCLDSITKALSMPYEKMICNKKWRGLCSKQDLSCLIYSLKCSQSEGAAYMSLVLQLFLGFFPHICSQDFQEVFLAQIWSLSILKECIDFVSCRKKGITSPPMEHISWLPFWR